MKKDEWTNIAIVDSLINHFINLTIFKVNNNKKNVELKSEILLPHFKCFKTPIFIVTHISKHYFLHYLLLFRMSVFLISKGVSTEVDKDPNYITSNTVESAVTIPIQNWKFTGGVF